MNAVDKILLYLTGDLSQEEKQSIEQSIKESPEQESLYQDLSLIHASVEAVVFMDEVRTSLQGQGFIPNRNFTLPNRVTLKQVILRAATVLLLITVGVLAYSNLYYSNARLVQDNILVLSEQLDYTSYQSKGEDPGVGQKLATSSILEQVKAALLAQEFEKVEDLIAQARMDSKMNQVDQDHIDWIELQLFILMNRPAQEILNSTEYMANNKQHFYNLAARELLKKENSVWRKFVF